MWAMGMKIGNQYAGTSIIWVFTTYTYKDRYNNILYNYSNFKCEKKQKSTTSTVIVEFFVMNDEMSIDDYMVSNNKLFIYDLLGVKVSTFQTSIELYNMDRYSPGRIM